MKRDEFGFVLPNLYYQFLTEWKGIAPFEIGDSGICLYAKEDLQERNETYQIEVDEPDFFLIGQERDLAYFIRKNTDDSIYENDLGALGSLEMQTVATTVYDFIDKVLEERL
jgi:hypothetical protein